MRPTLIALGSALAAYGGWLLVSRQHLAALVVVGVWLAAGVLVHDGLVSPLLVGLGRLTRRAPRALAAAGVVVLVVLGSVTVVAVPVLGRFGARSDDPTLLPRDYTGGWLVVAAVVLSGAATVAAVAAAAAAAAAARLRSTRAGRRAGGESSRRG
jgi:hypothetical protein